MREIHSTTSAPGTSATPVLGKERIHLIDALRGFALFGVLTSNIWLWFSGLFMLFPDYQEQLQQWSADSVSYFVISTLISGKFITTFSFLFGLGFSIQLQRAADRAESVTPYYLRRLLVLLVFGLSHAILLWYGDILAVYSLLGFVLLLFAGRRSRTILIWIFILLVLFPLVMAGVMLLYGPGSAAEIERDLRQLNISSREAFSQGGWAQIIEANLTMYGFIWLGQNLMFVPFILAAFLIGLLAGRAGVLSQPADFVFALRRVQFWGLIVGGSAHLVLLYLSVRFSMLEVFSNPKILALQLALLPFSIPVLAAFYVVTFILLFQRPRWRRLLELLAPVGRMALTNYLSQSLICVFLYYGFGLGLMDRVGPATTIPIALVIFFTQVAWSHWWMASFRFGPIEWLWRSLTYAQMQPMRRR